jgi:hypothetical protein
MMLVVDVSHVLVANKSENSDGLNPNSVEHLGGLIFKTTCNHN